jgi:deoxyribodipyrimidine photo-lyase
MSKSKCVFIFFRDFRLIDNTTLEYLTQLPISEVLPIFIFNPTQIDNTNLYKSDASVECLCKGLVDLNQSIKQNYQSKLNIYYGKIDKILSQLLNNLDFKYIAYNKDLTPFASKRNKSIKKWAKYHSIKVVSKCDYCLLNPETILTNNKGYYKTFKYFYLKVIDRSTEIIGRITPNKPQLEFHQPIPLSSSIKIYHLSQFYTKNNYIILPIFTRNEILRRSAPNELEKFKNYVDIRNFPQYDTTHFATFLKYGLISFREIYARIYHQFGKDDELLRQLVWKEYYAYLMYHLPQEQTIGGSNFQNKIITWENNKVWFDKWKCGKTGFPFIDACMRQMNVTSWMHNRGRLCVANFLVYCLMIDWKWGEKYFAQKLIDYDISQNNGNWQWCAGVGIDRKPYLRMYNPFNLINKYDKECIFVKKWCPELKDIPNSHLKNWDTYCNQYNVIQPIVNYKERREKAILYLK